MLLHRECTEVNVWCDVCGFDYTQCGGEDKAGPYGGSGTLGVDGTAFSNSITSIDGREGTAFYNGGTLILRAFKSNTTKKAPSGILYYGSDTLNLEFISSNVVSGKDYGLHVPQGSVSVTGNGSLSCSGTRVGIEASGTITVGSGTLEGNGIYGMRANAIVITGGTVTATGSTNALSVKPDLSSYPNAVIKYGESADTAVVYSQATAASDYYKAKYVSIYPCTHGSYTDGKCTTCGAACSHENGTLGTYAPTEDGTQHVAAYSCCGATVTGDHTPDENGCTVNNDGTHSFTCDLCGTVTENHSFGTGNTCVCGAKIEVTGMRLSTNAEYRYDADTNTYTVIAAPDNEYLYVTVHFDGKNLEYLTEDNTALKYELISSFSPEVTADTYVGTIYSLKSDNFSSKWDINPATSPDNWLTYRYSNDGGTTWSELLRYEVKQAYAITVNASENGTVTADKSTAAAGDTVTLTAKPETGYVLGRLTVTNTVDTSVVTDVTASKTFVMPASPVAVNAVFVACDHSGSQHTTATPNNDGTTHSYTCTVCGGTGSENCSGGEATCITLAKCDLCGGEHGEVAKSNHEREEFTYTADGATITATCASCNSTAGEITLTVVSTNLTYDGTKKELKAENTIPGVEPPEIACTSDLMSAGKHTATITLGGATATLDVTIEKATPEVTAPTAVSGLVYNGEPQTLINAGSTNGGTMQYSLDNATWSTELPKATVAGKHTVYYKVVGDNNHNDVDAKSVEVTINPKTISIVGATIEDVVYNETGDYTLNVTEVAFDGAALTLGTDYTATAVLAASDNNTYGYHDATVTVTLTNANYKLRANTFAGTVNIVEHTHVWSYELSGTDTIVAKCSGTISTCSVENQTVTIKLSAPALTTYGGGEDPVAKVNVSNSALPDPDVQYKTQNGDELTAAPTNAGTYTASITVGEGDNAKTASVTYTIAPKNIADVTITLSSTGGNYIGSAHAPSVNVSGLTEGTDYTVTFPTDMTNAGTKTITVTGKGNYTGKQELSYTISPIDPAAGLFSFTAPSNLIYTGTAKAATVVTNEGIVGMGTVTVTYSADPVNVGDYTVSIDVAAGTNFKAATGLTADTWKFSITKAPLTVKADDKTMTTGYALPDLTYTITGFVSGEDESVLTTKPVAETSTNGQTVGTFDITVSGAVAANYAFTYVKGTLTVVDHQHNWTYTAKDGTITAKCGNADSCPDAEQSITLKASDALYSGEMVQAEVTQDGTDLTYTLHYTGTDYDSADAPTNAGDYTVTMTVGDESVSDTFTISPKNIANCSASLAKNSFTYTGEAPALTVTVVDNGVGSYTMKEGTDYTIGSAAVNAGSHKLTVTGTGNYTGSVELDYSIVAKEVTPTIEELDTSYIYTGKAIQPTVTVKDGETALNAGTDYDVTYGSNTNVADGGSVTVTLKGNYSGKTTVGFDITPASVTITGKDTTVTYDGEDIDLRTMFTIDKNAGAADYTIIDLTGDGNFTTAPYLYKVVKVGTFTVLLTTAATDNYAAGEATATLTVNKADAAVTTAPTAKAGLTYTSKEQELITAGEAKGGEMQYSLDGETYTKNIPTGKAAGTYTVWYYVKGDDNHSDTEKAPIKVTIGQKELIPAVTGSVTKVFDNSNMVPTNNSLVITLTGIEDADNVTATATYTYDGVNVGTTKINAVDITLSGTDKDNYSLSAVTASAEVGEITKADPEYTVPIGLTATYGDTLAKVKLPDGFSWTNSSESVGNVGTKDTTVIYTPTDIVNYNTVTDIAVSVEVGKADPLVTEAPTANTLTYTGEEQALVTAGETADGIIYYSLDENGTYSESIPTGITAGEYTVWYYVNGDKNHVNSTKDYVPVTIKKTEPTFEVPTGLTAVYGDTLKTVALETGFTWEDESASVGNVGENTFAVVFTPEDTINYNMVRTTATVAVTAKDISGVTLTLDGKLTYTGEEQEQKVLVGEADGLEPTYEISGHKAANVGVYQATVKGTGNFAGTATILYTVHPDTSTIDDLTETNVTSADKDAIHAVKDMLNAAKTELADEDTKKEWSEILMNCDTLLDKIEAAASDADTEDVQKVQDVTAENVKPENKDDLTNAKADLEKALKDNSGNYTEAEKEAIQKEIDRMDTVLNVIQNVEDVTGLIEKLPDKLDVDTKIDIQIAQKAYEALTAYEKTLVDADVKAKLESLTEQLKETDIDKETETDKGTETDKETETESEPQKSASTEKAKDTKEAVATGDNSNTEICMLAMIGAFLVLLLFGKKRYISQNK